MFDMAEHVYNKTCEKYGLVKTSEIEDVYSALKYCKDGNCYNCKRHNKNNSNNYECKKQLINDCFEILGEIMSDLYEYRRFQERLTI